MDNLLKNGSFEGIMRPGGWTRDTHTGQQFGEIYTPEGWVAWWQEGDYGRPEMKVIQRVPPFDNPPRIDSGEWAVQAFTFSRRQHCGYYQIITGLIPGETYEIGAKAHAWSANPGLANYGDARCSAGVGCGAVVLTDAQIPPLNGDPENDAIGNFTFQVGVSFGDHPDPFYNVRWGERVHIYNVYADIPPLRFTAPESGEAVVYVRSESLWAFRTSDFYLDSAYLIKITETPPPEPERGLPRVQYSRTYILLPPDAGEEWAKAALENWDEKRQTIGGSADDGGVGNLDQRKVIAVNPDRWPGNLAEFYTKYYPGVELETIEADTPLDLQLAMRGISPSPPSPPSPDNKVAFGLHDGEGIEWMGANGIEGAGLLHFQVQTAPVGVNLSHYASKGIRCFLRVNWGYADGTGTLPPPDKSEQWINAVASTIKEARGLAGVIVGNEINNPSEWPGGYPRPSFVISPEYYVSLYNAICARIPGDSAPISPAPLDPYNIVAGEFGIAADPKTWAGYIYANVARCDFITIHAKTQGADPAQCADLSTFTDPPLEGRYLHLATILDQASWIPEKWQGKEIVVAELNPQRTRSGSLGWDTDGAEWVKKAAGYLRGIDRVSAGIFYRYLPAGDQAGFGLKNRGDILEAIKAETRR